MFVQPLSIVCLFEYLNFFFSNHTSSAELSNSKKYNITIGVHVVKG